MANPSPAHTHSHSHTHTPLAEHFPFSVSPHFKLQYIHFSLFLFKMRLKVSKMRPKTGKQRPKTGKMRHKMTKMRPKMGKTRRKMAKMRSKMPKDSFQCIRRHRSLGRAPGGAGRGLRSRVPCGVPTGTGPMGPWSSTTACVVGATGSRRGLQARHASCHFGGMRGAAAIFHDKHCLNIWMLW